MECRYALFFLFSCVIADLRATDILVKLKNLHTVLEILAKSIPLLPVQPNPAGNLTPTPPGGNPPPPPGGNNQPTTGGTTTGGKKPSQSNVGAFSAEEIDQYKKFMGLYGAITLKPDSDAWELQNKLDSINREWKDLKSTSKLADFLKKHFMYLTSADYVGSDRDDQLAKFLRYMQLIVKATLNMFDGYGNYKGRPYNVIFLLNDKFQYDKIEKFENIIRQPYFIFTKDQYDLFAMGFFIKDELEQTKKKDLKDIMSQAGTQANVFSVAWKEYKGFFDQLSANKQKDIEKWIGLPTFALSQYDSLLGQAFIKSLKDDIIRATSKAILKTKLSQYTQYLYAHYFSDNNINGITVKYSTVGTNNRPQDLVLWAQYFDYFNNGVLQTDETQIDLTQIRQNLNNFQTKFKSYIDTFKSTLYTNIKEGSPNFKQIIQEYTMFYGFDKSVNQKWAAYLKQQQSASAGASGSQPIEEDPTEVDIEELKKVFEDLKKNGIPSDAAQRGNVRAKLEELNNRSSELSMPPIKKSEYIAELKKYIERLK